MPHSKRKKRQLEREKQRMEDQRIKVREIRPLTENQAEAMRLLEDDDRHVVFLEGPAGTGKTMLAVHEALQKMAEGVIDKIVLTRPMVESRNDFEADFGALPGNEVEKMDPYLRPLIENVKACLVDPTMFQQMLRDGRIEICALAFMRGRTFHKAACILDEAQNTSHPQVLMFLTRIGNGSYAYLAGDTHQSDTDFQDGLNYAIKHLEPGTDNTGMFGLATFTNRDVVRSKVVKAVLKKWPADTQKGAF